MMKTKSLLLSLCLTSTAFGSLSSIDERGINSQGLGLNGLGITIGQAEEGRPGVNGYDSDSNSASNTNPSGVYHLLDGGLDLPNSAHIDEHATLVAGNMIGTSNGECPPCGGPAPGAALHAISLLGAESDLDVAISLDRLILLNSGTTNVRAINLSFSVEHEIFEQPDGNSHLSQYVDWSAKRYDKLYVISWSNTFDIPDSDPDNEKPQDSYNGITVASSMQPIGENTFRKYSVSNDPPGDWGDRTSIDLLAPGYLVTTLGHTAFGLRDGASYAAPHVTGAIAQLHQYAENNPLTLNARKHEVMKAVLLNSADKRAGVHGSTRDIFDSTNTPYPAQNSLFQPLHPELGAGHINVARAVTQLEPDEYNPGMVPLIGWDYNGIGGSGDYNEYIFNQSASGYIAVTLAWDRIVEHTGGNTYHYGDMFFNQPYFQTINNLDLYLVPASATEWSCVTAVWCSTSFEDNIEHMWRDIPAGQYKIIVQHNTVGGPGSSQNYGLAWWFGAGGATGPGDFNGDGNVDAADYVVWRKTSGSTAGYTEWRSNFGNTYGSGHLAHDTVPEPTSCFLGFAAIVMTLLGPLRRPLRIAHST